MTIRNRFTAPIALATALAIPVLVNGCSSDNPVTGAVCCTEFKVGGTIDAKIGGSAQSQVAAQAVADLGGIASASVDDLTTACRNISQDLDAPKADQDAAEATADKRERLKAWCDLAVKQIGSVKASASATINIEVVPPKCEASISAKANCQAKCDVSGKCDIKANPPKCTGGTLQVSCKGDCTASAGATVSCEGTCSGNCSGSCTASGGVDCTGKCEGTCEAGGSTGGSGAQMDGTCKGVCKGTCSVTPPNVKCSGSCAGKCDAACKGSATASVKCDGTCAGDFEPLKCEGGKLEGGCKVDAKCDANCDASVSAKAECTPPAVKAVVTASAKAELVGKLEATLEANLPLVFAFKAKLEGIAAVTGSLAGNIDAVADIKVACIPPLVAAVGDALANVKGSVSATASVTGSVGK